MNSAYTERSLTAKSSKKYPKDFISFSKSAGVILNAAVAIDVSKKWRVGAVRTATEVRRLRFHAGKS